MKYFYILQNCEIESAGNLGDYLDFNQISYKLIHTYRNDDLPALDKIEAIIILGIPISATEYKKHKYLSDLYDFSRKAIAQGIPMLGICFGGQLLSMALGGTVTRNPVREIGLCEIELTKAGLTDPLFAEFDASFKAFQWHQDTFSIPPGGDHLAFNKFCQNQAFRKGKVVGLQFHLESRIDEIVQWCELYKSELDNERLEKERVLNDLAKHSGPLEELNAKLLDNFVNNL